MRGAVELMTRGVNRKRSGLKDASFSLVTDKDYSKRVRASQPNRSPLLTASFTLYALSIDQLIAHRKFSQALEAFRHIT